MNTQDWEGIYVNLEDDNIPDKSKIRVVVPDDASSSCTQVSPLDNQEAQSSCVSSFKILFALASYWAPWFCRCSKANSYTWLHLVEPWDWSPQRARYSQLLILAHILIDSLKILVNAHQKVPICSRTDTLYACTPWCSNYKFLCFT